MGGAVGVDAGHALATSAGWNDTGPRNGTPCPPRPGVFQLAWSVTSPSHHDKRSSASGHASLHRVEDAMAMAGGGEGADGSASLTAAPPQLAGCPQCLSRP